MKNVKFYPKRLLITVSLFLCIPLVAVIARVADIHIPTAEEESMLEGASEAEDFRKATEEQEIVYGDWEVSLNADEYADLQKQNEENNKEYQDQIKEDEEIYKEYKDKWIEQPTRKVN